MTFLSHLYWAYSSSLVTFSSSRTVPVYCGTLGGHKCAPPHTQSTNRKSRKAFHTGTQIHSRQRNMVPGGTAFPPGTAEYCMILY
ncbi:hypothetical protein HOY80DRAFT_945636 [Tuber brumale]|nr:hypothetical protein HOY80DRAFT_945636 [Tuber brumale]